MAFYDDMRNMATSLLTEFGNPFTLKKPDGEPKYNPKTKKTQQIYREYSGICVKKMYTDEAIGMLVNIVQAGDVSFVCTMNDVEVIPKPDLDKLVYQNIVYNIVNVKTCDPSGEKVVVHFLQCRKAGDDK